jgi:hypothetical protein
LTFRIQQFFQIDWTEGETMEHKTFSIPKHFLRHCVMTITKELKELKGVLCWKATRS